MKVKLTYFRQGGKYYAEGEYETELLPKEGLFKVWAEIEEMFRQWERPGLVDGPQHFITLVEVPEHPHNHPRLIMPTEKED